MPPEDVIKKFAHSMGMDGVDPGPKGVVVFDIASVGRLFLEVVDEGLLIYLARTVPPGLEGWEKKALSLCYGEARKGRAVHCGLGRDGRLVFLCRVSMAEMELPEIESVVEVLTRLHEAVGTEA